MEKEHFKDRCKDAQFYDKISEGDIVLICEKHKQKTASRIEDLTEGIVWKKLTKKSFHPRGIKVMLMSGEVGRVIYILKKIE